MAISTHKTVEGGEKVHHQAPGKSGKSGKSGKKGSARLQPPMTPMIDVTFQLLLFFLLTCEFRESEGMIPGSLPDGPIVGPKVPPPVDPIRIRLIPSADRQSARYEMTGVATAITSPGQLGEMLLSRQQQIGREVPIVIFPTADVPWRFVVEAFNQAKKAKFEKIGFAQPVL